MKKIILLTIVVVSTVTIICSCAGTPMHIATMSPESLQSVNTYKLANAYAKSRSERVRDELIRRNVITSDEWTYIDHKKIRLEMSEVALICSWGKPGLYGRINKSVGSYGVHRQYVYRKCSSCSTTYVYVKNGKVTSWQR